MAVIKPQQPQSSFLSIEKDMNIIIDKILKNERLKRLLYYTTKDALDRPNLTEDQSLELIGKNIKITPEIEVDKNVLNYLMITFSNFSLTSNPEFKNNTIEFDIICHFSQWLLKDFAMRAYKIAAEIDSMMANCRLTGIGKTQFLTAKQENVSDEYIGVCLIYTVVHGGEDKKKMPNPNDEERFQKDWNDMNAAD